MVMVEVMVMVMVMVMIMVMVMVIQHHYCHNYHHHEHHQDLHCNHHQVYYDSDNVRRDVVAFNPDVKPEVLNITILFCTYYIAQSTKLPPMSVVLYICQLMIR